MTRGATETTAMARTTRTMLQLTHRLGELEFTVSRVQFDTPDGRTWAVEQGQAGGFRLFELDVDDAATEYESTVGDEWNASDLIDYLAAIGD
jgi:hypothetical protein